MNLLRCRVKEPDTSLYVGKGAVIKSQTQDLNTIICNERQSKDLTTAVFISTKKVSFGNEDDCLDKKQNMCEIFTQYTKFDILRLPER